jgi:hypothetical protein
MQVQRATEPALLSSSEEKNHTLEVSSYTQSGFHVQCWIQLILQLDSVSSYFHSTPKAAKLLDEVGVALILQ